MAGCLVLYAWSDAGGVAGIVGEVGASRRSGGEKAEGARFQDLAVRVDTHTHAPSIGYSSGGKLAPDVVGGRCIRPRG